MHERLEVRPSGIEEVVVHSTTWSVIAQIVALDVVFSLDSVIAAIGMVDGWR